MGRLPTGHREFEVQKIWNITHEIMRLHILGLKNVDIADRLGITAQTVSNAVNSSIVKRQIAIMQGARDANTVDVTKRVLEMAPKALDVLENIMTSENETGSVRLRAAVEVLNRNVDTAPVRKTETHAQYEHFLRGKHIDEIKKIAKERGLLAQNPEEAVYEDIATEKVDGEKIDA